MGHNQSSSEHARHPYLRKGFYLNPDNQFWLTSNDEKYKDRMNKLAESFYHRNSIMLNLINTK